MPSNSEDSNFLPTFLENVSSNIEQLFDTPVLEVLDSSSHKALNRFSSLVVNHKNSLTTNFFDCDLDVLFYETEIEINDIEYKVSFTFGTSLQEGADNEHVQIIIEQLGKKLFYDKKEIQVVDEEGRSIMLFPKQEHWQVSYYEEDDGLAIKNIRRIINYNQFQQERATLKISLWIDCEGELIYLDFAQSKIRLLSEYLLQKFTDAMKERNQWIEEEKKETIQGFINNRGGQMESSAMTRDVNHNIDENDAPPAKKARRESRDSQEKNIIEIANAQFKKEYESQQERVAAWVGIVNHYNDRYCCLERSMSVSALDNECIEKYDDHIRNDYRQRVFSF